MASLEEAGASLAEINSDLDKLVAGLNDLIVANNPDNIEECSRIKDEVAGKIKDELGSKRRRRAK